MLLYRSGPLAPLGLEGRYLFLQKVRENQLNMSP